MSEPATQLDVREDYAVIVRAVLRECLPRDTKAYVFGSRAHGGARRYSDLDLALEWDQPLSLDLMARLAAERVRFDLIDAGG
jgi:amidophosphoribosyltransferase